MPLSTLRSRAAFFAKKLRVRGRSDVRRRRAGPLASCAHRSSQYGLDLLFEAPAGEVEDSSELAASAAEFQSVADAEMPAAPQRAAKEIGLKWVAPPRPANGVQERHLWLNLAEMRDAEKVHFLDAPISQVSLFGDTVEEFAQLFSTVKKQTEAIKHILPQRAGKHQPSPTQAAAFTCFA
ncbi:hypothetical protein M9458_036734, partial [Cirrhinus mrigala]